MFVPSNIVKTIGSIASRESTRYAINAVKFGRKGDQCVSCACDGRRLVVATWDDAQMRRDCKAEGAKSKPVTGFDVLIPRTELDTVSLLIPRKPGPDGIQAVVIDEHNVNGQVQASGTDGVKLNSATLNTSEDLFPSIVDVIPNYSDADSTMIGVSPTLLAEMLKVMQAISTNPDGSGLILRIPHNPAKPLMIIGEHGPNGERAIGVLMPIAINGNEAEQTIRAAADAAKVFRKRPTDPPVIDKETKAKAAAAVEAKKVEAPKPEAKPEPAKAVPVGTPSVDYAKMTPGQKAAYTRKLRAAGQAAPSPTDTKVSLAGSLSDKNGFSVTGEKAKGQPEAGKVYRLTGGTGEKAISNGNTWKESEVAPEEAKGGKPKVGPSIVPGVVMSAPRPAKPVVDSKPVDTGARVEIIKLRREGNAVAPVSGGRCYACGASASRSIYSNSDTWLVVGGKAYCPDCEKEGWSNKTLSDQVNRQEITHAS